MMFCHGRKKKYSITYQNIVSYQVKGSSWGGNSHYLIITETMQVRSWKGLDFLGVYEICWMPTLFLRIPESGFQIIKWLKNLIFKNHMKKKKESDEDESQIISFQDKPQLSHL